MRALKKEISYGFCLSGTLLMTTLLLSLVMFYVKSWHFTVPLVFFLLSGFIDGLFFASSLQKVP
jgi:KUP system potassium uptake protein